MSFDIEREIYIKKLKNIVSGIEKINNIENSRIISNETRVEMNNNKDKASKLLQKLEKGEFEIAVIGLEKAGKSSFSNAIMDNDVLPTADARCTYTATCIKAGEVDHAIVTFFSVEEFNKEFRDKLKLLGVPNTEAYTYNTLSEGRYNDIFESLEDNIKDKYENTINQDILDIIKNVDSLSYYIGSSQKQYSGNELSSDEFKDFIQKPQKAIAVKEIVIETTKFGSMKNAIMYDVPGFDSPTAMHRQQTLAKMRDVDAIIMVANAKAPSLRGPELDILKEKDMDGAPLYDKLFVFSNKADMVDSHEAFEKNRETTYSEWIERRKITNRRDRIFFGSAIASLGEKIGDAGNDAKVKINKIGITDGISELKNSLEKYYKDERFDILKKRIDSIISHIQDMFERIRADKNLVINSDMNQNMLLKLYNSLLNSKNGIQSGLEELKGNINIAEQERKLSQVIEVKVNELVSVENNQITDAEIKAVHRNKAGNGVNENPNAVEPVLRELKFRAMYNSFQKEVSNIAREAHINNFNATLEIFKKELGLKDRDVNNEKLLQNISEFINGRKESSASHELDNEYFNSLIERFARDIYEILILKTRGQDRYNKFRERAENYISMGVFYSAKKSKLSGDEFSYLSSTPAQSPMWKILLWPELLEESEYNPKTKSWEIISKFTGIFKGRFGSIDRLVDEILNTYGDNTVGIVTKLFDGFVKSGSEVDTKLAVKDILDDYLRGDRKIEVESDNLLDILSKPISVKRNMKNSAGTEFTYKDIQDEFIADIKVLNDVLKNAFVEAINMDRAFSAREVGAIEKLIQRVNSDEFSVFVSANLRLIKYDEMSEINDEQARQKADEVLMNQINDILANLDIKS